MDNFFKKYLPENKNILSTSENYNIIKLLNELNIKINYVNKNKINDIQIQYCIVISDLIDISLNKLINITDKYLILLNIENNNKVDLFMETNDKWIYSNDEWTLKNKMTIIKKKEEHEKNIICIVKENAYFYNPKSFELFDYYFKNNYKIVNKNIDNIKKFIDEKNSKNNVLVFIHSTNIDQFDLNVVEYLQKSKNIICNIYIIVQDWWVASNFRKVSKNHFRKDILKAQNYKIIVIAENVKMLSNFNDVDCLEFTDNIICYNYWGIYKLAIVEFNNNPYKKILISGNLHGKCYPERQYMKNLNNKFINVYNYNNDDVSKIFISDNNFSKELNKYLCCFMSSVYVVNIKQGKNENTHIILLKTFEILASGSLLLVPSYEEPYLKKIGLIKGEHYLTLNFNDDMNNQINYLFEESNISNVNKIRYNGYMYGLNNLTNKQRFIELNEIFIKS